MKELFRVGSYLFYFVIMDLTYWIVFAITEYIMNDVVIAAIIGLVGTISAGLISGVISARHERKSQVSKNTEAIERLIMRLGISDEETLTHKISGQYEQIRLDIGRETRGNGSLTSQHDNITREINRDFNAIHARFEKTDAEYRRFTSEQHDIAKSVENFVIDYRKMASDGSDYRQKIYELESVIQEKDIKIQSLEKTVGEKELNIQSLNSYIDELENKLDPPEHDGISL